MKLAEQLLSENKKAIDRNGLIAILTLSIGNEIEETAQGEAIYSKLIDKLQLNIPKDKDYRPNIYSYFGIQKKPNDTVLMASDEIGKARINQEVVNDFKKLLSVEPIHVDRKGQTQVEVTLDLKLIFNTNAVLNFPSEHAKALERRIVIIPCEHYVDKSDPDLINKLQSEKKGIFLYLMYLYKQMISEDIERLENERVTEITHDWLNFGYEFVPSKSASIASQKACIDLLKEIIVRKSGSRVYAPNINNIIKPKTNLSSQVINKLVQANFNVKSILNDGNKYWVDLAWKESDKNENDTDEELSSEGELDVDWEEFEDE